MRKGRFLHKICLLSVSFFLITFINQLKAQDIVGNWVGQLQSSGIKLRLVFHFTNLNDTLNCTLDSPDQSAFGLKAEKNYFQNDSVFVQFGKLQASYKGMLQEDTIKGVFIQNNQQFPLNLIKTSQNDFSIKRPQNPIKPYPYLSKDVMIKTRDGRVLAGTLTQPPKGKIKHAVLLVSGSGPQNRDEEILNHKPFLVLSDYLTKKGIAILRYDDRGVGKSTGNFSKATTFDLAEDALFAFNYLEKKYKKSKVGIIGHSEGGLIAPIIASENTNVDFIVLMAGPSVTGKEVILDQSELIMRKSGMPDSLISNQIEFSKELLDFIIDEKNKEDLKKKSIDLTKSLITKYHIEVPSYSTIDKVSRQTVETYLSPWMNTFLKINPLDYISKVNCPILALFGGNDLQVSLRANLMKMYKQSKEKPNMKVKVFEGLNHLFQKSETGLPSEYGQIEETLNEGVMKEIAGWIIGLN